MSKEIFKQEELDKLRAVAARNAAAVEEAMRRDLAETLAGSDELLVEALDYALFNGGKRIRPLLVIMCANVCGCREKLTYKLASAFEYLHVATLIHDDIIDNARERRGKKSLVHAYTKAVAILTGDWLHAHSMRIVGQLTGRKGLDIFSRSTTAMVDGEFQQLRHSEKVDITEEQYFAIIHRKTAGLIGAACEIGAMFGGANDKQRAALKSYGINLGCAFQIVDDLLDYTGDHKKTGKKVGNDFVEGKPTLPLLRALANSDRQGRKMLTDLFGKQRQLPENFQKAKMLIDRYNGFSSACESAEKFTSDALRRLDDFNDHSQDTLESLAILKSLAYYVLQREK